MCLPSWKKRHNPEGTAAENESSPLFTRSDKRGLVCKLSTPFEQGLAEDISAFFNEKRLLFWLEALALTHELSGSILCPSSIAGWLTDEFTDISDTIKDAQRFVASFGSAILRNTPATPHLYLSFAPTSTIFAKFAAEFARIPRAVAGNVQHWLVMEKIIHTNARNTVVAMSPDGNRIVSGSDDGKFHIRDVHTGEALDIPLQGHTRPARSVAIMPDGTRIVSGSFDNTIRIWDAYMAGNYSGKTISNYVHGVRAWHVLHGLSWALNDPEVEALLKAANSLTPLSSKRSKRDPYIVDLILVIREQLDLRDPLDAAVFACLTSTFYATARTAEFTSRLDGFNPALHIKPSNVSDMVDRNNLSTKNFHLPRTKSAPDGEDVFWAKQHGLSDPDHALSNHLAINEPPPDGALFASRYKGAHRPLTKSNFLNRLAAATKAAGRTPLQGHGIWIGSTLEYLLRNVPFDVVKMKGRWANDTFSVCLRRHAQIMAPFIQATGSAPHFRPNLPKLSA